MVKGRELGATGGARRHLLGRNWSSRRSHGNPLRGLFGPGNMPRLPRSAAPRARPRSRCPGRGPWLRHSPQATMPLPWAFTPWRAIEPPAVSDQDWQQPVDRFGSAAHLALALIGNSRASTERQCLAGPLDALVRFRGFLCLGRQCPSSGRSTAARPVSHTVGERLAIGQLPATYNWRTQGP